MQKMLATLCAIRKSLSCESNASDVYDPDLSRKSSGIRKFRFCKPISRLKGVADGGKKHRMKPTAICSSVSIRRSEVLNPVSHQVCFKNSTCEPKITRFNARREGVFHARKSPDLLSRNSSSSSRSQQVGSLGSRIATCEKCGQGLNKREDAESHHLSNHAVTELVEGDVSRNVIERIVETGQPTRVHVIRILKVHNLQTTVAKFEDYREMVKIRAYNQSKKNPRCLADGNELLRFYCTTFTCSLGERGLPALCRSDICNLCSILRHGFKNNKALSGVLTASTAGEAYDYIQLDEVRPHLSKALILCRVIAGRVHGAVDVCIDKAAQSGFDSVAGKLGPNYCIQKLHSLHSSALLACFVVVCQP